MATRKKKTATVTERVADHRARVTAEGGKQIAVMLDSHAAAKLEAMTDKGITITEAINKLLHRVRA